MTDIEPTTCTNYTRGRRHPQVIGKIADIQLPVQLTLPQAAVMAVVLFVGWQIVAGVWGPVAAMVAARIANKHRPDGRSPSGSLMGWIRLILTPSSGVTGGRPVRSRRRQHVSAKVTASETPPADATPSWECAST